MKNRKILVAIITMTVSFFCSAQNISRIVYPGNDGKLIYMPYTSDGDLLPDFSYCGYKGGGMKIPYIQNQIILEPKDFESDDSHRIQSAIDELAKREPDNNGFRGAVLLKKGKYNIQNTIKIQQSGIVLRGEGDGENETVLIGTKSEQMTLISVGNDEKPQKDIESQQLIVNFYVPSGTNIVAVDDASKFKVGDNIIIERVSTKDWISLIGMDKIEPNWQDISLLNDEELDEYRSKGLLNEDGTKYNVTVQWEAGSKNLCFERKILEIEGNNIIFDIPLTNAIQMEYGGGFVYKYTVQRLQNIGVENLRGESVFDKSKVDINLLKEEYYSDEQHTSDFLLFAFVESAWAKNLTSQYITNGYKCSSFSKFITIEDCKYLDPVSKIEGGRRYGYTLNGQFALVQRCYSRNGRHDFVLGATVAGPNVFVDSSAELCWAASEPHQRWATGCLFDNCNLSGREAYFSISNRGFFGSGHGWAGAQMVLWNCKAPVSVVMAPPTGQNFSIGNYGKAEDELSTPEYINDRINKLNMTAKTNLKYEGIPVVGNAYIEFPESYVTPQFLYYKQLLDRLGAKAVKNVTTKEQQKIILGTN